LTVYLFYLELHMKCRITVLGGVSQGTVYELTDGTELVIGRGTDSDTAIDDVQMSRVHCRVTTDDQWATLTDAGSSSGTFVAGKLIESKLLKSGDILTVGKTELLFEDCEIVQRFPRREQCGIIGDGNSRLSVG
jgi:pSer/pThr/pTyr-binding forkhead associated (FHA) protein